MPYLNEQEQQEMISQLEAKIEKLYRGEQQIAGLLDQKLQKAVDRLTLGFFESNTDLVIGPRGDCAKNNSEGMAKVELSQLINDTINSRLNPRVVELKNRLDAIKKSKAKSERNYKSKVQALNPKTQEIIHYANIKRLKEKYKK